MKVVETALLYAPSNSAKVTRMKAALIRSGVRVKLVKVEQFNQTIGDLIGLKQEQIDEIASSRVVGDASAGHEINENLEELEQLNTLGEEVLVLWNFSSPRIDGVLNQFKKAGVPKVALKAVVTPNNINWTFAQLIRELQKEHAAYKES